MKKYGLLVLLLAVMLLLSSCIDPAPEWELTSEELRYACCAHAIPGMHSDYFDGQIWLMETDVCGRTLIKYRAFDEVTRWWTNAYVICQRITDTQVFFYEDICYLIEKREEQTEDGYSGAARGTVSVSNEQIAELKARNDWDLPINEEKMATRTVTAENIWGTSYIYTGERYKTEFVKALETVLETDVYTIVFQDADGTGHEIYYVDTMDFRQYMVMVSHDSTADDGKQIVLFEIENEVLDRDAYVAFKKANGWVYGS